MADEVETVIVGGGQAGLATSYWLGQLGRPNIVLEQAAYAGSAWRDGRWDSFTLVTPNWSFRLPGAEYDGPDPDGFILRDEIVARFERYAESKRLPVRYGLTVTSIEAADSGEGFKVKSNEGTWQARRVVVATGLFQKGKIPDFAKGIPPTVRQIESGQYRNPQALESGAVLIVGSGQSGAQIAEELNQAGRKVYLCVGNSIHAQRRYRGRDLFEWLMLTGFTDRTVAQLPSPQARFFSTPLVTGKEGGHALNLHSFYRNGVTLLGHLRGIENGCLQVAPDLQESLTKADQAEANALNRFNTYIEKAGISAPPPEQMEAPRDAYNAPEIPSVDLQKTGIATIIWAKGHQADFSLVKFPVFEESGFPQTQAGVTAVPGLYFAGLPWQDTMKTGLLVGVGESTAHLAEHIQAR